MFRVIGIDQSGIARVFAEAEDEREAYAKCRKLVYEYVKRRPDTGPASEWLLECS
jgi:hypothetical protein